MSKANRRELVESFFDNSFIEVSLYLKEKKNSNWEIDFLNVKSKRMSTKFRFWYKTEADIAMLAIKRYSQFFQRHK